MQFELSWIRQILVQFDAITPVVVPQNYPLITEDVTTLLRSFLKLMSLHQKTVEGKKITLMNAMKSL